MIDSGIGVGLIPAMAIASGLTRSQTLVARPLSPSPTRTIALVARPSTSRRRDASRRSPRCCGRRAWVDYLPDACSSFLDLRQRYGARDALAVGEEERRRPADRQLAGPSSTVLRTALVSQDRRGRPQAGDHGTPALLLRRRQRRRHRSADQLEQASGKLNPRLLRSSAIAAGANSDQRDRTPATAAARRLAADQPALSDGHRRDQSRRHSRVYAPASAGAVAANSCVPCWPAQA